jgi:hypothetical protein
MAFASALSFSIRTKNPGIFLELHRYTKDAGDASGTVTRTKGRKIRRILKKSDATATATITNKTQVSFTGLAAAGSDSLSGFVLLEVERI